MTSGPITSWQIDGETEETVTDFILGGSKITVDGDCSHEIKRCLLLRRNAMTNLDSILESREITLPTKIHLVQFSSVTQSCPTLCNPWTEAHQDSLSITYPQSLLRLLCIELVMPSNHLTLCCPLLLLPSIFPASGSFPMSHLFTSSGQSFGVSASASVLPMNIQDWFPLRLTGLISLQSKGPQESSPTPQFKSISSSVFSFLMVQLSHPHRTTGKIIALTRRTFVSKMMSLLFNTLSAAKSLQ